MKGAIAVAGIVVACSVTLSAQWPKYSEPGVPRDPQGRVMLDAPPPKMPDGRPDLTGDWVRADRDPRPAELAGITADPAATARSVVVEPPVQPFPADPKAAPLATFWEIGANLTGGL